MVFSPEESVNSSFFPVSKRIRGAAPEAAARNEVSESRSAVEIGTANALIV